MIDAGSYNNLGQLLHDAMVMHKSRTALVELSRKRESSRMSYLEMRRASQALQHWFTEAGVKPGDRVAILMSNQPRWLLAASALLARGAVLVPLDYKLTAPEHDALLSHSGASLVVAEYAFWRKLAGEIPALVSEAPPRKSLPAHATDFAAALESPRLEQAPWPAERDDIATIVYSSGTGGAPKGCMLSHGAYLAQLDGLLGLYPMSPEDSWFSILPTNHAIDFMCGFLGPLACGARVVHQRALRPEFLLWSMKREGITHMAIVPLILEAFERGLRERLEALPPWQRQVLDGVASLHERLTERRTRPRLTRAMMASVRAGFGGKLKFLFCGGAFVDREHADFFHRMGIDVVIGYGLTEACTVVTVQDLAPFRADSVGRPLPGTELRIHEPGPDGIGEVWVHGPTLMSGYLDDPAQTAEVITEGWLRTGDLGWLDASGHLHLVGRRKNMIVTAGGKNIYPEDIEGAFAEVPCEELVVFATDFLWPRERMVDETLVAVLREGEEPWADALSRANRGLPEHKRISHVLLWEREFPRTASMKVKRLALAEVLRAGCSTSDLQPVSPREVA